MLQLPTWSKVGDDENEICRVDQAILGDETKEDVDVLDMVVQPTMLGDGLRIGGGGGTILRPQPPPAPGLATD